MLRSRTFQRWMTTKCKCWCFQKRAYLSLRVHKAIPEQQVVLFFFQSIFIEWTETACHITIESLWIWWKDGDCDEAVFGNKCVLSSATVLFSECFCCYVGAYLVESVVSSVFKGCWCLFLMSHYPFFVILAPFASYEFIGVKLGRKLKAKALSQ